MVCEGEPWRIGSVGTAAVQQCPLKDAEGTGRHPQLHAVLGSGAYLAAAHRFTYRLNPLRRPFVAAAVEHGAAILRGERVNRADHADADRDVENRAMAEPLRHRQTKGAETDMPSLPPPRHIPTLPRLCENLVICLISSGKGRYGHGVQRLAHLVGGSSQDRQLQSRRPAAVLSGLPQAIATPVARLERR